MDEKQDRLKDIEIENFIWIIYFILIFLSFWANKYEKRYFLYNQIQDKEKYRQLLILIFSIALIIYAYFFYDGYQSLKELNIYDTKTKKKFTEWNFIGTTLILIAGIIFLGIAIQDQNIETEIAFT